ncbi:recombinase family protein [Pseudarthrobacter sulfonivorans]|uniref:recombinase family protein n=1 Tax=Pseudarthrobacter sulfonivorans TaxID=121292 RepID=UPI00277F3DB4|nr:recombinase family protein [Pseudarthrobacter sulfonivorans]MDQ0000458.1 DNA invertase Pin-like site-specific DNA recombinase [Pseudarthrobacter sulfonivorans]
MTSTLIGYARVSSITGQRLDLQQDALKAAGCVKVYEEKMSGSTTSRPELDACLSYLRDGDVLVVYKLDRLGRSLKHLLTIIDDLRARGIGFKSLTDGIDTTTSTGRLMFSIMGSFAEFERSLIQERTNAGLKAARDRGKLGGRPTAVTPEMGDRIVELRGEGKNADAVAKELGIGRATVYRFLKTQEALVA